MHSGIRNKEKINHVDYVVAILCSLLQVIIILYIELKLSLRSRSHDRQVIMKPVGLHIIV